MTENIIINTPPSNDRCKDPYSDQIERIRYEWKDLSEATADIWGPEIVPKQ